MGIISIWIFVSLYCYQTTLDSIKFVLLIKEKTWTKTEKELYEVKGTKKIKEKETIKFIKLHPKKKKKKENPGKILSIIWI